jgi:general transcription factor 3C polypeptide 3 (transcription factor C subunit 4)
VIGLCLGVAYIRMVMQRKRIDRHLVTVLALSYMFRYFTLRGGSESAEACYNVGRAFHHLQLVSPAATYYKKALAASGDAFKFEAAHNLALIYRESGSPELASKLLRQHCVV